MLDFGVALLSVAAALLVAQLHFQLQAAPVSLFLCATMFAAWFGGIKAGALAAALSVLSFSYYFLPPLHSLAVDRAEIPRLVVFLLAAVFVLAITGAQKQSEEKLRKTGRELQTNIEDLKRAEMLLAGEKRLLEMIARGDSPAPVLEGACRLVEELASGALSSILLLHPKTNQLHHGAAPSLPIKYTEAIDGLVIGPCVGSCGTAAYRAEPVTVSDISSDPLWADYRDLARTHGLQACWSTPILSSAGKVLGTFAIYYREPRSPTPSDHNLIGRITHLASIALEREQAENALRQAEAELAHMTRLTTMGELTASIAHEVNQPLTAVVNNANACISLLDAAPGRLDDSALAASQHPGKGGPGVASNLSEVREALMEIIDDADRASAVIMRIRQLAKKAPTEKLVVDLRSVVKDVLALARHESASRGVSIRIDLPQDLPLVSGDRVQLQQVLLNLVMNAMDAMKSVEESNRILVINGRREIRGEAFEAWLSVQDAGIGFKPEEMERLFEAFYTTKPDGMGMGLAISRSIIQAHGGRLWAEPNSGPGATFSFSLPAARPERSG